MEELLSVSSPVVGIDNVLVPISWGSGFDY